MVLMAHEITILEMVAQGLPSKTIAVELGFSDSSVKRRLSRIYRKIGAVDRANAVAIAMSRGWITLR